MNFIIFLPATDLLDLGQLGNKAFHKQQQKTLKNQKKIISKDRTQISP